MSWTLIIIFYFLFLLVRKITGNNSEQTDKFKRFNNPYYQEDDDISPASFELNLLSLCTLVIRANGRVTQAELDFVRHQFVQLYGKDRANAVFRTFNQLKGREISAQRVAGYMRMRTNYETRLQILYFLFGIAQADGFVSADEVEQIEQIAFHLQISRSDYESIKAMFTTQRRNNGGNYSQQNSPDAYAILGITASATDAEVKQAYRAMAKKYHPDKVITDDEAIKKGAEEKFKQVQQAYEQIARQRGMS